MNRDHVISAISDTFKEVNGFRPRGIWDFEDMSDTELLELYDRLCEEARLAYEEEEARRVQSAKRFEEFVLDIIAMGAGDRQTALRWLLDTEADNYPYDVPGVFCFEYNLPYSYEAELKAALNA